MLASLVLFVSKAISGACLILWGAWGERRSVSCIPSAVGFILFAAFYYAVNFALPPFLYIGTAVLLIAGASLFAMALFSRPLQASCLLAAASVLCLQITQSLAITFTLFLTDDIEAYVWLLDAGNLMLEPICCVLALPFVAVFKRLVAIKGGSSIRWHHLLWLAPALLVYLCQTMWQVPNFEKTYLEISWMPLFLMSMMFVLGMATVIFPFYQLKVWKERYEKERIELLARQYYESMLAQKRSDDETRRIVHDLRNQISCALEASSDGRGAAQLGEIERGLSDIRFTDYTSNATMDTVLNQKRRVALARHIEFQVTPLRLPSDFMAASDLCSVVSNALDNAIEECDRLPVESSKYVTTKLSRRGDYIAMVFVNPCSKKEPHDLQKLDFPTSKSDERHHGIGLSSIRYCVEKYRGNCTASIVGGEFRLTVLVPISAKQ